MQEQENQLQDKRDANNVLGMNSDTTFSRSKGIDQKCYNPMIQICKGLFCGGREHVRRTTNVTSKSGAVAKTGSIDRDQSDERRAATDLPVVAKRGKGCEYRLVRALSFWYGVGLLLLVPCLISDSTRSAGVLGMSISLQMEGVANVGEASMGTETRNSQKKSFDLVGKAYFDVPRRDVKLSCRRKTYICS